MTGVQTCALPICSTPLSTDNKWIAPIADADRFDYSFFGLSRAEARNMDPQQRLVLEESWRAFEDAGLSPSNLHGVRCGVLVGAMNMSIRGDFGGSEASTDHAGLGSFANMLANRVSHAFRLNGPSMVTDSACASGIVALHEANRLIHSGDCDMALVAGVNLNLDPWKFVAFSKARMTSPSGACRPFDSKADGYIMGDGVGAVLATSIETAEKLGCHIHGLVLGTAIRHCAGAPTITAPSATMQCETILAARNMAGIHAMDYVEAHGTGTSLGDPIEIEGLRQANASAPETKEKRPPYPVASLKGNVGHLEGAAGMAGLIKVLSMFKAREIPPTAGLTEVNPIIDLDSTGLRLPREREPWTSDTPLVAGVSSFGIGGVMAHAVLQEPPAVKNRDRRDRKIGRAHV